VGCFVLRLARPCLVDDALRKLNRRHAADELQHSRVGWAYLSTLDARRRDLVSRWLPILTSTLAEACCEGPERPCEELVAFGYFTPRLLREAHESALRAVIVPGLLHLGIGEPS
jgi:hypothetical protein